MAVFTCLSVCQPFAYLIVTGKKTIELRPWNTKFRGEFLIHAPLKVDLDQAARLKISPGVLDVGGIIGKAVLYDTKRYNSQKELDSDYKYHFAKKRLEQTMYGFLLKSAKKFTTLIPCKGQLGFFRYQMPDSTIKDYDIVSEIFDEQYRTQWINHH